MVFGGFCGWGFWLFVEGFFNTENVKSNQGLVREKVSVDRQERRISLQ